MRLQRGEPGVALPGALTRPPTSGAKSLVAGLVPTDPAGVRPEATCAAQAGGTCGRCNECDTCDWIGPVVTSMIPPPDLGLDGAPHLVFQPAIDLSTGRLLGFEALLRWQDSSGRAVPPNALIPWAEARGRMTDLNAWVLLEACSQAARWPANLQLAVNCSVFQLRRGEAAAAAAALEQAGFAPDRLMVEVTETAVIDEAAVADLQAMSRLGIQLTLDDVGSDWSILKNLQDCTVNTMKIDGELIEELKVTGSASQAVVETIVKISRSLGICTVAEAVETAVQVTLLRDAGVDVAQGYFFSPPISADDAFTMAATDPLPKFPLTAATRARCPRAGRRPRWVRGRRACGWRGRDAGGRGRSARRGRCTGADARTRARARARNRRGRGGFGGDFHSGAPAGAWAERPGRPVHRHRLADSRLDPGHGLRHRVRRAHDRRTDARRTDGAPGTGQGGDQPLDGAAQDPTAQRGHRAPDASGRAPERAHRDVGGELARSRRRISGSFRADPRRSRRRGARSPACGTPGISPPGPAEAARWRARRVPSTTTRTTWRRADGDGRRERPLHGGLTV